MCFFVVVIMYTPYVGYSTQSIEMMQDLGMNHTQLGALASITGIAGGIVLPFAGVLADRWGAKNVIIVGLIILGLGQLLFALAPSFLWLASSRVIIGFSVGILFVAPYTLVMRWLNESDQVGKGFGILISADGIGTLAAMYLFAFLMAFLGWREGSAFFVLIIGLMIILSIVLLREPQSFDKKRLRNDSSQEKDGEQRTSFKEYLKIIRHRNVIAVAFFISGFWGSYTVASIWVPTILMEELGWSEALTGFIGATYAVAGIISAIFTGRVANKFGKRKPLILIGGTGLALAFIGSAIAQAFGVYSMLAILLPIAGFSVYIGTPLAYALATDSVGIKKSATATGFIMAIGITFGGALYPFIVGYIRDLLGTYTLGFIVAGSILIVMNVLIPLILLKDIKPRIKTAADNGTYVYKEKV